MIVGRMRGMALLAGALAMGCAFPSGPAVVAVDARGEWQYSSQQVSPTVLIEGTLIISAQSGAEISGTASWTEDDTMGGELLSGGLLTGRVIASTDVDFDVLRDAGDRRHIARLVADTMSGAWVELATGRTGEFRAIRQSP